MSGIGDRFREIAALYDAQPKIIAAGEIVREDEIVVSAFSESHGLEVRQIATALYQAAITLPDPSPFAGDSDY